MRHTQSERTGKSVRALLAGVALLVVVGCLHAALRHSVASADRTTRGATLVMIDVNPGGTKAINLASPGYLPVAILGGEKFDVTLIKPSSLSFAGAAIAKSSDSTRRGSANEKGRKPAEPRFDIVFQDVNSDGRIDLLASFPLAFLKDLSGGRRTAVLKGQLLDGSPIEGSQTIQVTGESLIKIGRPALPAGSGFCSSAPIVFPVDPTGTGDAAPYPSNVTVAALTGVVTSINVRVNGISHTSPDDLELLLVSPNGRAVILDNGAFDGTDAIDQNLTFSDTAATYAPTAAPLLSGTYRPISYFAQTSFNGPAPILTTAAPYAATLSAFKDIDPNGTWSLYARDVVTGDTGSIASWCLDITTGVASGCGSQLFQGSLTAGDTTQIGNLNRDGTTGLCGTTKVCPATASAVGNAYYDSYTITNSGVASACVTATATGSCNGNLSLVAYQPTFDPASLCLNYLNDSGTTLPTAITTSQTQTMAFTLAAGQSVVLVVHEITPGTGCTNYGLLVESDSCGVVVAPCSITCPGNIVQSNDQNQCGAVVTYPPPTTEGTCGIPICTPPSGSFFPVGTTTVTCDGALASRGSAQSGCASPQTITHSASQAITPLNSVSCNDGVGHTNNSYWRAYTLSSFGIVGAFDVLSIDVGVETAVSGGGARGGLKGRSVSRNAAKGKPRPAGGSQPITVNLYTSSMPFPTGFPGSLTLIGTVNTTIADQDPGSVVNVPITGMAAAGSELVVEVFTPDGTAAGNLLYIGSNAAAETGPSYLLAADCGITTPTTTTAIGFPDMHIVLNVNGCAQGSSSCMFTVTVNDTQPPTITCPASTTVVGGTGGTAVTYPPPTASDNCPGVLVACVPPSGSTLPLGSTTITCTATDASVNTATCAFIVGLFDVCLQDTSNPGRVLLINSASGEYQFCCDGTVYTGTGTVSKRGEIVTLTHTAPDRRVTARSAGGGKGSASLQTPAGTTICTIYDFTAGSATCACPSAPPL